MISRVNAVLALAAWLMLGTVNVALADGGPTRTPWQQHDGFEEVGFTFSCVPTEHGDPCEYQDSSIPPADDIGWVGAPDPDIIGFGGPSASELSQCWTGDFTYFQTMVEVPEGTEITQFTIQFSGMDDGSRVSICNADHLGCDVVPGSEVYLGRTGTTDLSELLIEGTNRVVITQVDDCPTGNNLQSAIVVLNGESVDVPPPDADGDGVLDTDDLCLDTNLESTVTVQGQDSGVDNFLFATGCSISDLMTKVIDDCSQSSNHGRFVSCTALGLNNLRSQGVITEEERGALQSVAAQSEVGKPQEELTRSGKRGKGN